MDEFVNNIFNQINMTLLKWRPDTIGKFQMSNKGFVKLDQRCFVKIFK